MYVLPAQQEADEIRRRDGCDLAPQTPDGQAMNAGEQTTLAPFLARLASARGEATAKHYAVGLKRQHRGLHAALRHAYTLSQRVHGSWPQAFHPALHDQSLCIFFAD